MNKTAFVISVVLTTFVLMAVGGIVYAMRTSNGVPEVAPEIESEQTISAEATPTIDPSLEQALVEREAIYQQRIAEANARLEQAQQQLAQSALVGQQSISQVALTQITPEQAMQIAADFLGQNSVYWVEITTVEGEDLYLVTFTSGDMVYVNMAGQVVGSAPAQSFGSSGGGGGGGSRSVKASSEGGEHSGEHGGEYEHEDGEHESGGGED
jgi:hypothetical protein